MSRLLADLGEVRSVLRYWFGAVTLEEALASRPRAHRPTGRSAPPNVLEPGNGQPYFRVGGEHAPFVVNAKGEVHLPVDGQVAAFFEHWLRAEYRREAAAARFDRREDSSMRWVIGWPAVLFERRQELATLIRFPVEVAWRRAGEPWTPPHFAERRLRRAPPPPDTVVIRSSAGPEDEGTVASIDRDLLQRTLGVLDEELEGLLLPDDSGELEVVARVLEELLARPIDAPPVAPVRVPADTLERSPEEAFSALVGAVRGRLGEGVSVYPTAIVQDGALLFTTYHLKRELLGLLERDGDPPMVQGTPLHSYLTGDPLEPGVAELRGRFRKRGLTRSQRDAAEHALGSKLASVQGPPGTGKTELILNLAAHVLVARIESLAGGRVMDSDVLVVASTNNRAVDNVTDPLGAEFPRDRLPLALRAGNQDVTATTTRDMLIRARSWLSGQDDSDGLSRLGDALERVRVASRALTELTAPRVKERQRTAELATIRAKLGALDARDQAAIQLGPKLLTALGALEAEVERLVRISQTPGKKKLARIEEGWREKGAALWADVAALSPEVAKELALPPDIEPDAPKNLILDAWDLALEEAVEILGEAMTPLAESSKKMGRAAAEKSRLERRLTELEAVEVAPVEVDEAEVERRGYELFLAALVARERWAVVNRGELDLALNLAIEAAKDERSLRRFFDDDPRSKTALLRLFPVLGVTLLSLGNVFEDTYGAIDRLVIDEAGQCHPAYALCGLIRARRALLIGDVHQLPPVLQMAERDEARVRKRAAIRISDERFDPYRVHAESSSSAQALADRAVFARPTLVDHFRCQPEIIAISDRLAEYGLIVHTPRRSLASIAPRLARPLLFGATPGQQVRARGSWTNEREAERLLELLFELHGAGISWSEIGILTPYVGQLELLRARLRPRGVPIDAAAEVGERDLFGMTDSSSLAVGTVHRFQGGERPVILFSTVVTERRSLPFLDDRPNLLNVAISRARDHLVVFGHLETLAAGRHTRLLLERATPLR